LKRRKVLLLASDAPLIPLRHEFSVLSVCDNEVTIERSMVVRADIHVSLSAGLQKSVLKSLNTNVDTMLLKVFINDSPRLCVVASDAALRQEIKNDAFG